MLREIGRSRTSRASAWYAWIAQRDAAVVLPVARYMVMCTRGRDDPMNEVATHRDIRITGFPKV